MSKFIEKMTTGISRREFLKKSAAATAAAAGLSLMGNGMTRVQQVSAAEEMGTEHMIPEDLESQGKWVTVACWHNCGGRCLNKALVVDGVVIRQKTDDTHEDSPDYPQQRGCGRGRSQRKQVFGPDRLKYPMKRKHWEPGGGDKSLRGRDEWERITWDEAFDIVASEITRISENYGNTAISLTTDSLEPKLIMANYNGGGYCLQWGPVSWGTWPQVYPRVMGKSGNGSAEGNDRMRLRESKLIVLWGVNSAYSSSGNPTYNYLQAKKAGAKFICVDPIYTDTARVLADQWIPCRPGTDTALALGMMYHIVANNLHDKEYLDKYCVGFDKEHMPEDATTDECFLDYLMGGSDGVPKTPEWASEICGTPVDTIKAFAEEYATTKPATITSGGAPARINNGENYPHALLVLGMITGNHGKIGGGVSPNMNKPATFAGPAIVAAGSNPTKYPNSKDDYGAYVNHGELWNAVLTGNYKENGEDKTVDIRMVWHAYNNTLNQRVGLAQGIKAHREKLEFVLCENYVLNTDAKYSDIVLPVATPWEKEGQQVGYYNGGNREAVIYYSQVTEPLYEAKTDMEIALEIGTRLGLDPAVIQPNTEKEIAFSRLYNSTVLKEDGSGEKEPLVGFTAEDIAYFGVEAEPREGRIMYQDYKEQGIYQAKRYKGDPYEYTSFMDFIADPEANPVDTPSGKFEIYCQSVADKINSFGWSVKDPLPKYDPAFEGYEDGQRDGYPFMMINIHYPRRSHSTFDNVSQLRHAFPQEFWMNPQDAEAIGVKEDGEVVLITSRYGQAIRPVYLTSRMMPGVCGMGEGAWVEVDEETGIDKAGACNYLIGPYATGQGHAGYNTCGVKIEKYTGSIQLDPDYTWPQRIVEFE